MAGATYEGLEEFRQHREALQGAVRAELRAEARSIAEQARSEAQRDVPKSPGGGHVEILMTEDTRDEMFIVYDKVRNPKAANLTLWLEFGTVHMAARPFFFPAINRSRAIYPARMDAALQRAYDATVNR